MGIPNKRQKEIVLRKLDGWTFVALMELEYKEPSSLTGTEAYLAGMVRRMHDRDNRRYYEAKDRAENLEKPKGEFFMDTPSAGLGDSPELLDLLEYLKDTAYYWPACQFGKPNGKTEPPCVTSPNRWHCSRPGDWAHFPIWRKHAWRQPKD